MNEDEQLERMMRGSPRCDFCSSPRVTWMYPADDTSLKLVAGPDNTPMRSSGGWVCCATCKNLIENAKPRLVIDHIVDSFLTRNPKARRLHQETEGVSTRMIRRQVALTFGEFRKAKKGQVVPFG